MSYDKDKWGLIVDLLIVDDPVIYEFGTAGGNNLHALLSVLSDRDMTPYSVVSFDSFEGLPEESPGVPINPDWVPGAYNLISETNNKDISDTDSAFKKLQERFSEYSVKFIKGFYSDTLTNKLSNEMEGADIIHIDCDLYISAYQALDWAARNGLISEDCLIRFDDWAVPGLNEGEFGESKAFKEVCDKYHLSFELIIKEGSSVTFRYMGRNRGKNDTKTN